MEGGALIELATSIKVRFRSQRRVKGKLTQRASSRPGEKQIVGEKVALRIPGTLVELASSKRESRCPFPRVSSFEGTDFSTKSRSTARRECTRIAIIRRAFAR